MVKIFNSHRVLVVLLLLVGAFAVTSGVLRLSAMVEAISTGVIPEGSQGLAPYLEYPLISILHILPGSIIMILAPFQFIPSVRQQWPKLHRWSGRVLLLSGVAAGGSAIAMAIFFPTIVNHLSTAANFTFGAALITALFIAYRAILRRDITRHRAWMIRAYAIALTPAIMRIVFSGLFLVLGEGIESYLPVMIWVTFLFDVAMAELILRFGSFRKRCASPSLA